MTLLCGRTLISPPPKQVFGQLRKPGHRRLVALLVWGALACLCAIPLGIAASSPYLASRNLAYIVAGFAGIACLGLFLVQPLLAAGYLPGLPLADARKWHRRIGTAIVVGIVLHVGGLYVTSPPDTIDALTLASPTPFSIFGVAAMWGAFVTAALVLCRRKLRMRYPVWHIIHNALALFVVVSTVIHAVQIDGTMGPLSKSVLCAAVLVATCLTLIDVRIIKPLIATRARKRASARP